MYVKVGGNARYLCIVLRLLSGRSLAYQNKLAEQQKLYSEIDGIKTTM